MLVYQRVGWWMIWPLAPYLFVPQGWDSWAEQIWDHGVLWAAELGWLSLNERERPLKRIRWNLLIGRWGFEEGDLREILFFQRKILMGWNRLKLSFFKVTNIFKALKFRWVKDVINMSYQCDLFFHSNAFMSWFHPFFFDVFFCWLFESLEQSSLSTDQLNWSCPFRLLTFTSPTKKVKVERLRLKTNDDSQFFESCEQKWLLVSGRVSTLNFHWLPWWRKTRVTPAEIHPKKRTFIASHCWWVILLISWSW